MQNKVDGKRSGFQVETARCEIARDVLLRMLAAQQAGLQSGRHKALFAWARKEKLDVIIVSSRDKITEFLPSEHDATHFGR